MSITVNEIFYSIQGESSFAGRPCTFIRLTGCNLRCSYCDTRYAYEQGEVCTLDTVLQQIAAFDCHLVEITGGEPLLQDETPVLADRLLDRGYTVLLETNGSIDIDRVDSRCARIVDIKCPSSGQTTRTDFGNLDRLTVRDELKLVIGTLQDYQFGCDLVKRIQAERVPVGCIHFTPVWGKLPPDRLASWMLRDKLPVRLGLQLHKVIWPERRRGV